MCDDEDDILRKFFFWATDSLSIKQNLQRFVVVVGVLFCFVFARKRPFLSTKNKIYSNTPIMMMEEKLTSHLSRERQIGDDDCPLI